MDADDRLGALRQELKVQGELLRTTLAQLEAITTQVRAFQDWVGAADQLLSQETRRTQRLRQLARTLEQTLAGENLT